MAEGSKKKPSKTISALGRGWEDLRTGRLNGPISRLFLAVLAIVALIAATSEGHEAIGSALVGAAVAFGLGAAFFHRVIELGPRGVKLGDIEKLREAADLELEGADPQEREELLAEGREILRSSRSEGEEVSPGGALREARLEWEYNGFAVEIRFSGWLISRGWTVSEADRLVGAGRPDLVAERDGRRIAVEVKVGRRPIDVRVIDQLLALAASVEAAMPETVESIEVRPVLVVRGIALTKAASERALKAGVSVYGLGADGEIRHLLGPKLD